MVVKIMAPFWVLSFGTIILTTTHIGGSSVGLVYDGFSAVLCGCEHPKSSPSGRGVIASKSGPFIYIWANYSELKTRSP